MGNQLCWPTNCMCIYMTENNRHELNKVQRNSVNVFLGKIRNFSFSWSPRMGWVQAGDVGMHMAAEATPAAVFVSFPTADDSCDFMNTE